jgi:hypothetical protein
MKVIDRYPESWNETDPARRRTLIAAIHGFLDKVPA